MSIKAEDYLGRAVQNQEYALTAMDPGVRGLFERIAGQWLSLADELEGKRDTLA